METLLEWAAAELERLKKVSVPGPTTPASWFRPQTAAAVDFLERHAAGTRWAIEAATYQERQNYAPGLKSGITQLLEQWIAYARAGMATARAPEVEARIAAATDLMEQVDRLLEDRDIHIAAPIVLAGAALEEALRALTPPEAELPPKPGLDAYGAALKKAGLITTTEAKDVTAWAGQRNDAAHGHFERLDLARARVMVDAINLFMRRHEIGV